MNETVNILKDWDSSGNSFPIQWKDLKNGADNKEIVDDLAILLQHQIEAINEAKWIEFLMREKNRSKKNWATNFCVEKQGIF